MNNLFLFYSALFFGSSLLLGCISIGFTSTIQIWYFVFLCWGVLISLLNHGLNIKKLRFLDRCTMICGILINIYIYLNNLKIPNLSIVCTFFGSVLYILSKLFKNTTFHMIAHGCVYAGNLLIFKNL